MTGQRGKVATVAETSGSPQRTPEWYADRLGKVTGSRVNAVVTGGKGATRAALLSQLVAERLTGQPTETFTSEAMEWGTEQEPHAINAYSAKTGNLVESAPFVPHPTIEMAGASPDGYVNDDALIEVKCPSTKTMLEYILDQKVPTAYLNQIQFQLAVTGRQHCDFVAYDPRLPPNLQLLIIRVERDDKRIAELETETIKFLAEVEAQVTKLKEMQL